MRRKLRQIMWLILIWSCSIAVLALIAFLFRFLMTWAGFKA
jgi:hypothetical protein